MGAQHTPTPWTVYDAAEACYPGIDAARRTVVVFGNADEECGVRGDTPEEAEANARFIVHAVNCHDDLLEALEETWRVLRAAGLLNLTNGVQLGQTSWYVKICDAERVSNAAIAKARTPNSKDDEA